MDEIRALTLDDMLQMLVDAGRRCKGCSSAEIALFSMSQVDEGEPFTLVDIGETCWCRECGMLLLAEQQGEA